MNWNVKQIFNIVVKTNYKVRINILDLESDDRSISCPKQMNLESCHDHWKVQNSVKKQCRRIVSSK